MSTAALLISRNFTSHSRLSNTSTLFAQSKRTHFIWLDVQLNAKWFQLQLKKEISNNFLFWLGEIYVVFAMLKALEKYIKKNGPHQAFPQLVIYGPATSEQKKNEKHMKRCFEANTTLCTTQFCLYMECFVSLCPLIEKELQEGLANAAVVMKIFSRNEKDVIRSNHHNLMNVLGKTSLFKEKINPNESMENQFLCFINFTKIF